MRRGRVPRSRRHDHRRGRLSRSPRAARASIPWTVDAIRAAQSRRLRGRRGHQPGGHRARHLHGSVRRRGAPRTSPSGSRAGGARDRRVSTIARTIPTARSPSYAHGVRLPQAGSRACSTRRPRSSTSICARSFVVGDRWLDVAAGARGRRARRAGADRATARARSAAPRAGVDRRRDRRQSDGRGRAGFCEQPMITMPTRRSRATRCSALVDAFAGPRVAGRRRSDRRRVHLRRGRARLARGAGADPQVRRDRDRAGGAGNAANNVAALGGARARSPALVGARRDGRRLLGALAARRRRRAASCAPRGYRTPVKTRILAGGVHSAKQQVVRIDRDARLAARRRDAAARSRRRSRRRSRACDARAGVRLRLRARDAGARRRDARGGRAARAAPAGAGAASTRATRCSTTAA